MLTFLDKKYTPASKKNMHAERTNILVKHLGQEAFMFTDAGQVRAAPCNVELRQVMLQCEKSAIERDFEKKS
jgi:hypothetical protein